MRLCVCQPVLVPCSSLLLLSYFRPSTSSCVTYLSFAKYWNTLAFLSSRAEFRPPFCGGRNAVEGPAVSPAEQQVSRLRRHPAALLMNKNDAACSPLCNLLQGNQSVAELLGATFEFVFHSFALTLFFCGKKTFVISFSGSDQMENDAGQFVGCRRDGHGGSMAGTHFSIVRA